MSSSPENLIDLCQFNVYLKTKTLLSKTKIIENFLNFFEECKIHKTECQKKN